MNREQEIIEQARSRSEMCTTEGRDFYRIAFREGAEWADQTRDEFLPKDTERIEIVRNKNGKMPEKFREALTSKISFNKCVIAKFVEEKKTYVVMLDPDICMENDYEILNDFPSIKEVIIIKKA